MCTSQLIVEVRTELKFLIRRNKVRVTIRKHEIWFENNLAVKLRRLGGEEPEERGRKTSEKPDK